MTKALVTGGAGFIGSHLTAALLANQVEVYVIDDLSTGKIENVSRQAHLINMDVSDDKVVEKIAELAPDVVFHLAAQADVQRSIMRPYYDCRVNVMGTIHVLEALRRVGKGKIILASTSGVYGALEKERISITDQTAPMSFYGLSKWTAEQYIRLYHQLYGTAYTILRYANVYGPGQTPKGEGGVVSIFMERIKKGEPLTIFGDGEQTRDFIHVSDVVAANLAAAESGDGQTFHVSTGVSTSIRSLSELLSELAGKRLKVNYAPEKTGDIKHSCLNSEETRQVLGWQPMTGVRAGLVNTLGYSLGGE
ncbi:MAG: NAD-dependent epimerase/dehydratase family protein [Gorillibacterium sp.]|nr:NAD-dependent epimerase/dehydratase family protein [Gorillibacterium sp.]